MSKSYTPKASTEHKGWYEVPGFEGCCANRKGEILMKKTGHITLGGNAGRYLKISAYKDGNDEPSLYHVHELVCRAFNGLAPEGYVVLHGNNKRWDNSAGNLQWGTQSQNILDMYADGLKVSKEAFRTVAGRVVHEVPFFHLSLDPKLAGFWSPTYPHEPDEDKSELTEPDIKRISVSNSIDGALRGIYPDIASTLETDNESELVLNVYKADLDGKERIVPTAVLTAEQLVWNAHVTGECWILDQVNVRRIGQIRLLNPNKSATRMTHPFDDPDYPEESVGPECFKWVSTGPDFSRYLNRLRVSNESHPVWMNW